MILARLGLREMADDNCDSAWKTSEIKPERTVLPDLAYEKW